MSEVDYLYGRHKTGEGEYEFDLVGDKTIRVGVRQWFIVARAYCTCGWLGPRRLTDPADAMDDMERHAESHTKVTA